MATFLKGSALSDCLEQMIENADDFLYLISPYIKLHERIKNELKRKKSNDKLHIVIVFGKNEDDKGKSLSLEDINFLKDFPNIKICYHKDLHAKYYASEDFSLLTSMNLHQFSQNTNVEAGIYMPTKGLLEKMATNFTNKIVNVDQCGEDALSYFRGVIDISEKLFEKVPKYESGLFKKKYTHSDIVEDQLSIFFKVPKSDYTQTKPNSFNQYQEKRSTYTHRENQVTMGHCIRTGKQIPFNPDKPMSNEAFQKWKQWGDEDYPENYCHYTGEQSNGETSMAKPILRKNWSKAQQLMPKM